MRPPQRSTLFPYTTLFRSDLLEELIEFVDDVVDDLGCREEVAYAREIIRMGTGADRQLEVFKQTRSEEHTSELQSRGHLVCRLLLEKKKKKKKTTIQINEE